MRKYVPVWLVEPRRRGKSRNIIKHSELCCINLRYETEGRQRRRSQDTHLTHESIMTSQVEFKGYALTGE